MKVRALRLLAIAAALFAPIPSGAQTNTEGSTPGKCLDVTHSDDVTHKDKVPGVEPEVLLNKPIPDIPGKCIRITRIVIDPGSDVRCHTHPGDEFGIVLGGDLMLQRDGSKYEPAPKEFSVPRSTPMNVKNPPEAGKPAVLISILIINANEPPLTYVNECRD